MNEKLKFRAWDNESELMIYSDGRDKKERDCDYWFAICNDTLRCVYYVACDDSLGYQDQKYGELDNIMQYTGLNDKNGKEIYSGDIVTFEDAECDAESYHNNVFLNRGIVLYDETSMRYSFSNRQTVEMDDLYIPHDVEVIGNIYENPELLKEREAE